MFKRVAKKQWISSEDVAYSIMCPAVYISLAYYVYMSYDDMIMTMPPHVVSFRASDVQNGDLCPDDHREERLWSGWKRLH